VLVVDAMIRVQVEPPSVEYSSFTVGMFPSVDHVIVVGSPTVKVWPPFGAVTVTVPVIVKAASEPSVRVALAVSVTLTFAVVAIASGSVHV